MIFTGHNSSSDTRPHLPSTIIYPTKRLATKRIESLSSGLSRCKSTWTVAEPVDKRCQVWHGFLEWFTPY